VDEERTAQIGSYVTGRIINMFVILGDYVKPGDRLARITSPELTQSQLAFLRASSRVVVTQKSYDRAKHLLAADVIPLAEVERRQSELEIAQAELSAATDQLRLYGMDEAEIKELSRKGKIFPFLDVKATREGYIIARNVIVGQVVQPSDPLFQVADLSSVWVVGDVPEQIARDVRLGQHVEINVPAIGDKDRDGVIIFVSDTVNRLTRTVMTRVMVDNPDRKLKPDMLANMHITDPQHKSLVVPEAAVVRELNQDYVFVATGERHFQRVPVELGPEVADFRPVLSGLTVDQRIVMEGAFHLDSERKLAELE
jgi:cobalt-zinc-cadmium efflux system membrane fusion protein